MPVPESSVVQIAADLYRGITELVEEHAGAWVEPCKHLDRVSMRQD